MMEPAGRLRLNFRREGGGSLVALALVGLAGCASSGGVPRGVLASVRNFETRLVQSEHLATARYDTYDEAIRLPRARLHELQCNRTSDRRYECTYGLDGCSLESAPSESRPPTDDAPPSDCRRSRRVVRDDDGRWTVNAPDVP